MSELPPQNPYVAQPIAYSMPVAARPGLITAIGTLSIVVACLSLIASLILGFWGFGVLIFARASQAMATASVSMTSSAMSGAATNTVQVGPTGLDTGDRTTATTALMQKQPLTVKRQAQLETLLAEAGQTVLGIDGDITKDSVDNAVVDTGTMPGSGGSNGPDYFKTRTGQIEIYEDRAIFRPKDKSETIRTVALPSTFANTGQTRPTPAEVQTLLAAVQSAAGNKLNASQMAGLNAALSAPGQQLVAPGTASSAVSMANVQPDGTAMVHFTGGMLMLGPQGQVISQVSYNSPAASPVMGMGSLNPWAPGVVMIEAAASIALAVYLFIIGIMMLQQSRRAIWLHRIYCWLKIPLAIASGVGMGWMIYQFVMGVPGVASSGGGNPAAFIIFGGILTIVGCAYPIALLIALRSRTIREYESGWNS